MLVQQKNHAPFDKVAKLKYLGGKNNGVHDKIGKGLN
jgi:hypothetical protein